MGNGEGMIANTSLVKGALTHRLQRLQKSKMATRGPLVFGRFRQLSLNKFFSRSTPCMRKGRDGKKRKEKNDVFSGHYVIASSLPPERLRPNDDRWNAARSRQYHKGCPLIFLSVTRSLMRERERERE